jgi:hypothetical protein
MTAAGSPVGSLASEAGQLLDAITARLEQFRTAVGSPVDATEPVTEPVERQSESTHSCVGWCPICRTAEVVNGDRAETAGKLADAAILLVGTLRSLLPDHTGPTTGPADTGPHDGSTADEQEGPAPGVERIDIR